MLGLFAGEPPVEHGGGGRRVHGRVGLTRETGRVCACVKGHANSCEDWPTISCGPAARPHATDTCARAHARTHTHTRHPCHAHQSSYSGAPFPSGKESSSTRSQSTKAHTNSPPNVNSFAKPQQQYSPSPRARYHQSTPSVPTCASVRLRYDCTHTKKARRTRGKERARGTHQERQHERSNLGLGLIGARCIPIVQVRLMAHAQSIHAVAVVAIHCCVARERRGAFPGRESGGGACVAGQHAQQAGGDEQGRSAHRSRSGHFVHNSSASLRCTFFYSAGTSMCRSKGVVLHSRCTRSEFAHKSHTPPACTGIRGKHISLNACGVRWQSRRAPWPPNSQANWRRRWRAW